jgi:hypothetical protein
MHKKTLQERLAEKLHGMAEDSSASNTPLIQTDNSDPLRLAPLRPTKNITGNAARLLLPVLPGA